MCCCRCCLGRIQPYGTYTSCKIFICMGFSYKSIAGRCTRHMSHCNEARVEVMIPGCTTYNFSILANKRFVMPQVVRGLHESNQGGERGDGHEDDVVVDRSSTIQHEASYFCQASSVGCWFYLKSYTVSIYIYIYKYIIYRVFQCGGSGTSSTIQCITRSNFGGG